LIDFGCGALDTHSVNVTDCITQKDGSNLHRHATYVGTPFYTSPELFQRSYSNRTDVWSAGVTLYVLVAGFPSEKLQKAFDMLHKNDFPQGGRQHFLKTLPHMPPNLPDPFFDTLDMCLIYSHKHRKGAKDICQTEFVQFHKSIEASKDTTSLSLDQVISTASVKNTILSRSESTTQLYIVEQTAQRHTSYLAYGKFERSVTALLAAILDQDQLKLVMQSLDMLLQDHLTDDKLQQRSPADHQLLANKRRLQVVKISQVKATLKALQLEHW
jgi:serine/threonine protein kinase